MLNYERQKFSSEKCVQNKYRAHFGNVLAPAAMAAASPDEMNRVLFEGVYACFSSSFGTKQPLPPPPPYQDSKETSSQQVSEGGREEEEGGKTRVEKS